MFDYDVFLSFSAKDAELAKPIWQRLSGSGLRVFWSDETLKASIGRNFLSAIQDALVNSRHFVLYWSHNARTSSWVEEEYSTFYSQCYMTDRTARRLMVTGSNPSMLPTLPPLLKNLQAVWSLDELVTALGGVDTNWLQTRNKELEELVQRLRAENEALRAQVETVTATFRRVHIESEPLQPGLSQGNGPERYHEREGVQTCEPPASLERGFIVKDSSGYTHFFRNSAEVKFGGPHSGSGFISTCTIKRGGTTTEYHLSKMSEFSLRLESDRILVEFTYPDRPGTLVGEIPILAQYAPFEPDLYFRNPEDSHVKLPLGAVEWPVRSFP